MRKMKLNLKRRERTKKALRIGDHALLLKNMNVKDTALVQKLVTEIYGDGMTIGHVKNLFKDKQS